MKGTYTMLNYYVKATDGKATIINLVSLGASFLVLSISSCSVSKLAVIKLDEFLHLGEQTRISSCMPLSNPTN